MQDDAARPALLWRPPRLAVYRIGAENCFNKYWFKRYDTMPAELKSALEAAKSVPVDLDPVFSFPREVK